LIAQAEPNGFLSAARKGVFFVPFPVQVTKTKKPLERFLFSYLHNLKLFLDSGFRRNDDIFPAFAKTPSSRRKPGPSS
jgi:hypothetical protein